MLGQVIAASRDTGERVSNIVMMGIGEPLDNYDNVIKFLELVNHPDGLCIGYRHISLSTCGIVPRILELSKRNLPITLSISLHSTSQEARAHLMPIAKKYSLDELLDACRAVLHIKANAERYNINADRVFAVGFSAGGHLAGSLALLSGDKLVLDTLGVSREDVAVKAVVLSYPVVTALENTHRGSFENLTGMPFDKIPDELKRKYSLEENVTESSPPAFIWHTAEDKTVPVIGSLMLAASYAAKDVPVSLHVYPYGCHGISLATEFSNYEARVAQPLAQRWLDDSVDFLNTIK
jgi:predicted esterase